MNRKVIGRMILANVLEMDIEKYLNYVDRFITRTSIAPFYSAYYLDGRILTKRPKGVTGVIVKEDNEFRFYGPKYVKLNFQLLREPDNVKWKHCMNWIRTKNLFLHHVITTLLILQRPFWETLNHKTLTPMSLSEFLEDYPFPYLEISRLSRLLNNTWVSRHGKKYLLRELFWPPKKVRAAILADVVYQQSRRMKDCEIQALLKRDFGIELSVRTVCHYRNSIHVPAYNKDHLGNPYSISFSAPVPLHKKSLHRVPKNPGVYEISIKGKIEYPKCGSTVIYYGHSKNLRSRIRTYLSRDLKNPVIQHYREHEELFVRYMPTSKYLEVEGALLEGFVHGFGSLPAANRNPRMRIDKIYKIKGGFTMSKKDDRLVIEFDFAGKFIAEEEEEEAIVVSLKDITERKRAEEALRQSEEKYRTLFEESKDVVFISTPEGKFLDINPAGVELLGYASKKELLQVDIGKDIYFNPEDRKKYEQTLKQHGFVKDYELVLKRKDGKKLIVLETATAVKDENGEIVAYRGIFHDMTEHKQLEEQLRQAQKMETIGTLAGGVAHDFNNLLTVILGNAEFGMQDSKPDDPVYQNFLEIEKAATQARDLTTQLLSFSRRQAIKPKLLNLNKTIEDLLKMLKRIIGENIELKTDLEPKLATVWADPLQIQQVLMNLCVNARDAMPQGGQLILETRNVTDCPTERILGADLEHLNGTDQVKGLTEPGHNSRNYVRITITDTGVGMDKETQSRVFEPFFTTKKIGKGTGLGLSVVYGIVKQHQGHIEVSSEVGKGTTFKIYLPSVTEPEAAEQRRGKLPDMHGNGETILVVEDDEAVRNVTIRILKELGYKLLIARDGKEAMEMFEAESDKVDLLIMDVVMPERSGPEAYERMRVIRPDLPVIFITGYDVKAEIDEVSLPAQTPFTVLQKPYTKETLGQKVRELLDQ